MNDRIYLTAEEQVFLMEWLELNDPTRAAEKFAKLLVEEKANTEKMHEYVKMVMLRVKDRK
jgi:hypothetical protein